MLMIVALTMVQVCKELLFGIRARLIVSCLLFSLFCSANIQTLGM